VSVATLAIAAYFLAFVGAVFLVALRKKPVDVAALGLVKDATGTHGTLDGVPVGVRWEGLHCVAWAETTPDVTIAPGRATEGDFASGDPQFDGLVRCHGDPLRLRAALDGLTRLYVAERGTEAVNGLVTRRIQTGSPDQGALQVALEAVATIARALSMPPTAARLAAIARGDVHAGVRRATLVQLARAFPEEAAGVAATLLADPDPVVRVEAALLARAPLPAQGLDDALADATFPARLAAVGEEALLALPIGAAVARALASCGTARAVQPLLDAGYTAEARTIQGRLDGDAGRLTVAEEGGRLAIAGEAGRVTAVKP
jgi:hypothetical protein